MLCGLCAQAPEHGTTSDPQQMEFAARVSAVRQRAEGRVSVLAQRIVQAAVQSAAARQQRSSLLTQAADCRRGRRCFPLRLTKDPAGFSGVWWEGMCAAIITIASVKTFAASSCSCG